MIPQELQDKALWCVWKREIRGGNPTKVPYNPLTGDRAESNNPETFCSFVIAEESYKYDGEYDGVGVRVDNGFSFIDIDHCISGGELSDLAKDICQKIGSYTEKSPSGSGLRIVIKGDNINYDKSKYYLKNPSNGVEFYVSGMTNRFMTITGNTLHDDPIRHITNEELTGFLDQYMLRPVRQQPTVSTPAPSVNLDDSEIISKACQNEKFRALFYGDMSEYNNDHSSADLALCNSLAFWTGCDPATIDRIFRQSALYRDKWDRNDYRSETIRKAIDACTDTYNPDEFRSRIFQYTDAAKLAKFLSTVNRHVPPEDMSSIMESLEVKFSTKELNAIKKAADRAPSEMTIANEIVRNRNIIYVDQVGFYQWDGRVWVKTTDECVRQMATKSYAYFATAQRISAVCKLIKAITVSKVTFDRNPVLTFQNGTLEIETGVFREQNPDDYCSIIMGYDYDPAARCPVWENFIEDVTDEEPRRAEILQFLAGYVLMNDCRFQKIFLLIGSGGNGKSVYLEIIQKLFGDENVTHVEPTGLAQEFQRIRLKDSLLNIGADINSDFSRGEIREWLLKVADGTSVQACYKGMNHIDFIPRCKLVYACNAMPTADIVNGLNRRMQFVDFPCQYVETPDPANPKQKPRDIDIVKKLNNELPGIFNWAYDGYKLLRTVGYFTDAPEQAEFIQQFEQVSDPVTVFCDDHSESFRGTIARNEIYDWYKWWCDDTGHKPLSREKFLPKFRNCLGDRISDEPRRRIEGKITRLFVFVT
jgi:putative DNA primase/helicase